MRHSGTDTDTPFTCSGKGSGEFRLRRPRPGHTTHLLVQTTDPATALAVLFSRGTAPARTSAWFPAKGVTAGESVVAVAPADVTRVKIETGRAQRWSARVLDPEALPALEAGGASGVGGVLLRHSLGPVHAAVACSSRFGSRSSSLTSPHR